MEDIEQTKNQILKTEEEIKQIEFDLDNLKELALNTIEPKLSSKISGMKKKLKHDEEHKEKMQKEQNILKTKIKDLKKDKIQHLYVSSMEKMKFFKQMMPELKTSIRSQ